MITNFNEYIKEGLNIYEPKVLNPKMKQVAIVRALEIIEQDLNNSETEAIEELLNFIPMKYIVGFLPEDEWIQYANDEYKTGSEHNII